MKRNQQQPKNTNEIGPKGSQGPASNMLVFFNLCEKIYIYIATSFLGDSKRF